MITYNQNKHSDVNKLVEFVYTFSVVSNAQAKFFLKKLGLNESRTMNVLNIVKHSGRVFFSPQNSFIVANKIQLSENYTQDFEKNEDVIWLYLSLYNKDLRINLECKYPCKGFIYNENTGSALHVFRISDTDFNDDCIAIDTNFSTAAIQKSHIKAVMIVKNFNHIEDYSLPDCVDVLDYFVAEKDKTTNFVLPENIKFYHSKSEMEAFSFGEK